MDYKDIMFDIYDTYGKWTLIEGFFDIDANHFGGLSPLFNKDSYWVITGKYSDEMISDALIDIVDSIPINTPKDVPNYIDGFKGIGCYRFKALLEHQGGEYDECGRCTCRNYMNVAYIEMTFLSTFEERDREEKLNKLLNIDNIFDI